MSVRLLPVLLMLLLLAACGSRPDATPTAESAPPAAAPADAPEVLPPPEFDGATATGEGDEAIADDGEGAVVDEPAQEPAEIPPANTIAVGEPHPGAPTVVDTSCETDADCAIKDVGSCCGYRPACVNEASPTFPEQVKAGCAKEGRMGICGFPAITGCKCTDGQCEGTGSEVGERVR